MSLYSVWARKRYEEEQKKVLLEQEENNQMHLSEWLEDKGNKQPSIFVDQDNTLLYLTSAETIAQLGEWAKDNSVFARISGYQVAILPRPHALHFLSECRRIGKVYILTAGVSGFQKQVLDKVHMLDAVEGVYGRDNFHEVPQDQKKVLIDNLPFNHPNSKAKLHAMGGGMYLKVPDWEGQDSKDDALLRTISTLKKTFNSSSAA